MVLASLDLSLPPWEVVTILTGGLALSSFALSGMYSKTLIQNPCDRSFIVARC